MKMTKRGRIQLNIEGLGDNNDEIKAAVDSVIKAHSKALVGVVLTDDEIEKIIALTERKWKALRNLLCPEDYLIINSEINKYSKNIIDTLVAEEEYEMAANLKKVIG